MRPEDPRFEDFDVAGDVDPERIELIREVLAEETTWSEPPPQVLDSVLASVGAGEGPPPGAGKGAGTGRPWAILAAVAGVAAVAVALVWGPLGETAEPADTVVALAGSELAPEAEGTAAVRPTASGWWIRLDVAHLAPAPEGSYYQGWVANEQAEVSIGTFHMRDGEEPVVLWSGVSLLEYPTIAVTLQQEGGDHGPSNSVVLTGSTEGLLPED